jgi:predicted amidohydrolase
MKLNLAAVQLRPDFDRYRSFAAFRDAMAGFVAEACHRGDPRAPSLLVFPEALGLLYSLVPFYGKHLEGRRTVGAAVWSVGLRRWPWFVSTALRHRAFGVRTALLHHAVEAREEYISTFSELARREGAYIVAGSGLWPEVTTPPLRQPRLVNSRVYNVAPLLSPEGVVLLEATKAYRACQWEDRLGFSEGDARESRVAATTSGSIGVLICHDALRPELVQRCDAAGARVLAVPSYSLRPWQSIVRHAGITQEEAWLQHGLYASLRGRENLRYAVCAMLVGSIFDVHSEGRSFICANSLASEEGPLVAITDSEHEERVLVTTVELDGSPLPTPTLAGANGKVTGGEDEVRFWSRGVRADRRQSRDTR